jgi:5-methyltetrahydrofolate--homocysteine methyltransferase
MDLRSLLSGKETILLDGAMGTELTKLCGMEGGHLSLTHPEQVMEIHRSYIESGSRIITTNSLTMNRLYIETHKLSVDVEKVNRAAARLARSSVSDGQFVLGDMSATGKLLAPYGEYSEQQFIDVFKEQAFILAESGVDGFIIETVFDLREMLCAVKACKEVSTLPVMATISFNSAYRDSKRASGQDSNPGGRTIMGDTALDCARQLEQAGVEALGANCGSIDPFQMADIVRVYAGITSLPIIAQPNAGLPRLEQGRTVFDMGSDEFADGIKQCMTGGATILGGCCGTAAEHIAAVHRML